MIMLSGTPYIRNKQAGIIYKLGVVLSFTLLLLVIRGIRGSSRYHNYFDNCALWKERTRVAAPFKTTEVANLSPFSLKRKSWIRIFTFIGTKTKFVFSHIFLLLILFIQIILNIFFILYNLSIFFREKTLLL